MCMMHYMRVRRTGDSDIKGKPGPKPREATTPRQEIATLREQVASLRAENARLVESALRREVATTQRNVNPRPPPRPQSKIEAKLRRDIRQPRRRLQRVAEPPQPADDRGRHRRQ
jgi:hypothetical protein